MFACRRYQSTIRGTVYEQWKLEIVPHRRIAQGMQVEIQSYGCLSPVCGGVVMVREEIIGKRVHLEKRWAEYEIVDKATALSVTLLVPIEWLQMSLLDQFRHHRERHLLPDITPGPFPHYEKGEAQKKVWVEAMN